MFLQYGDIEAASCHKLWFIGNDVIEGNQFEGAIPVENVLNEHWNVADVLSKLCAHWYYTTRAQRINVLKVSYLDYKNRGIILGCEMVLSLFA